jgi:hypothetical protein
LVKIPIAKMPIPIIIIPSQTLNTNTLINPPGTAKAISNMDKRKLVFLSKKYDNLFLFFCTIKAHKKKESLEKLDWNTYDI